MQQRHSSGGRERRRFPRAGLGMFVGCASLVAYLALAGGAVTAVQQVPAEKVLDHFKCYTTDELKPPSSASVVLLDQFDRDAQKAEVGRALALCNPTAKEHEGRVVKPQFPFAHLVCRELLTEPPKESPPSVLVANQFGEQTLAVERAVALCSPALKNPDEKTPPLEAAQKVLDHFKCYAVTGEKLHAKVVLVDQFGDDKAKVHEPFVLCNPTVKVHGKNIFKPQNPEAHLVCYRLTPPKPLGLSVVAIDQFAKTELVVSRPDALCVPSLKKVI